MSADAVLRIHTDVFNRALKDQDYADLEALYSDDYMLVRPDGSVLNKQEGLQDLGTNGLRCHSIEFLRSTVRIYGTTVALTGKSRTVSSRNGMETRAHFRLVAVYSHEGESIRLVHFQSTTLPALGECHNEVFAAAIKGERRSA